MNLLVDISGMTQSNEMCDYKRVLRQGDFAYNKFTSQVISRGAFAASRKI